MSLKSHFYAYISKTRWLQRWGLKRNAVHENVMEHSWEVSVITHCLALLRNRYYGGNVDVNAVVVAALYHDCSEVITGDMPSPVKYHSPAITEAYQSIEREAERELVNLLPETLQQDYRSVMETVCLPAEHRQLIKAADTLSAYLKCRMELAAGNQEFANAAEDIQRRLDRLAMPEVTHFLRHFAPSYSLTLDEILGPSCSPST